MPKYKLSTGTYQDKKIIDRLIREAKRYKLESFFEEYGYYFCEDCKRSDIKPIDCSHDISVDICQKEGKAELAYNVDNITLRCRRCHNIKDKLY